MDCFCLTRKNHKDVLYWLKNVMYRHKIGSNMHSTLSIIKHIIYNESVSLISSFILCDLCYGCNLLFGVVICRDFYEVCLSYSAGKKNFNSYLREKES